MSAQPDRARLRDKVLALIYTEQSGIGTLISNDKLEALAECVEALEIVRDEVNYDQGYRYQIGYDALAHLESVLR